MANREDPLKDVIISSGGNKYLDPVKIQGIGTMSDSVGGNKPRENYGTIDGKPMKPLSLGTQLAEDMKKSNAEKTKNFFGDKFKSGDNIVEPTIHRIRTRSVMGDGPKSTLRPSKKMPSAFGRGVPYAGSIPNFFKTPHWQSIIGKSNHFIPNQGLFDAGISMGPKTLQGVNFDGAFPQINTQYWNGSTLPSATYQDQEDGG
jgi:hypothetical protein